jgi:hypothetical protein
MSTYGHGKEQKLGVQDLNGNHKIGTPCLYYSTAAPQVLPARSQGELLYGIPPLEVPYALSHPTEVNDTDSNQARNLFALFRFVYSTYIYLTLATLAHLHL